MAITLNGTTGIVSPKVNALDLELDSKNVVERGTNANGNYVRFADGTQICNHAVSETFLITSNSNGTAGLYYGDESFVFPAAFLGIPRVSVEATRGSSDNWGFWGATRNISTDGVIVRGYSPAASSQLGSVRGYIAIGRWY